MDFSEFDLSILGEIGNVSVGGAATSLSNFVNKVVTISIPDIQLLTMDEIKKEFEPSVVCAKIDYVTGIEGSNVLLLRKEDALEFSKLILRKELNENITDWNDLARNVLQEMFNIMVGNMSTSMSEIFDRQIKINPPTIYEEVADEMEIDGAEETFLTVWFDVKIENSLHIKLVNIITEAQSKQMVEIVKGDHQL